MVAAFCRGRNFEEALHRARHGTEYRVIVHESELSQFDVLGGKGSRTRDHPGSHFFRQTCATHVNDYFRTPLKEDDRLAIRYMVVDEVLTRGGRFLDPCPGANDKWTNIIRNDERLHEKIKQRMLDCRDRQLDGSSLLTIPGDEIPASETSPTTVSAALDDCRIFDQIECFSLDLNNSDWSDLLNDLAFLPGDSGHLEEVFDS